MPDPFENRSVVKVDCPCCGTGLVVDAARGVVLESRQPVNVRKEASLSDAQQLLKEESSRIHEKFQQIVEADKGRGATMEKKFKDFLEKAKEEPTAKPLRDIDLD
ncbi:MAG: hypothetical protein M0Z38_03720 [Deltaproteobacteria bacterium]|nr:hypothetical protein [Deltaproteobacteria bacterium]